MNPMKATLSTAGRLPALAGILPLLCALAAMVALVPRARADDGRKKQEIQFAEIAPRTVGDVPFFLVARATSHLPVSFVIVSGPAVLDGKKISLTGAAGLVIVRATQDGNEAFLPAVDAERAFEVNPRPTAPQISFQPAPMTVAIGEPLILTVRVSGEPDPALQWRKDGNPIVGAESRTLSIPAASLSDAGSYDVVASNSSGHATSARARVSVSKRSQMITFQSPGNGVAGQPVTLNAFASSGLAVQFDIVSGAATVSGGVLNSQAGLVIVEATQPGDSTFEAAAPVTQTVTFAPSGILHTP
jgi:hypothetical protein